jgi:hypothetical protein
LKQWVVLLETYAQLSGRKNDSLLQLVRKLIRDNH